MKNNERRAMTAALTLAALSSAGAWADEPDKKDSPTAPASHGLADVLEASGITATGYVDVSYQYLSGTGYFSSGTPDRVFDAHHDSFNLQQAAITLGYQPKEGFGALVNLTGGQDAQIIKSYPNTGGSGFDVTQAYAQYVHGSWTFIGGKFVTLAGAETINPTTDTNFSRSILFGYAIPFTLTGFRVVGALTDQLTLTLGINNGWDQVTDANTQKTLEFGATFTPSKSLSFSLDGTFGTEPLAIVNNVPSSAGGQRLLLDAVATWTVSDKLTLVGNVDYGRQKDSTPGALIDEYKWYGGAVYLNYAITDQLLASLRGEVFDDKNGYRTGVVDPATGKGQIWKEVTLTLGYSPSKNFLLRLEGRYDKSDVAGAFEVDVDPATGTPQYNDRQGSVALEAIYKF